MGFPRPAIARPTGVHIVVELGGVVIAETRRAVRTLETSHPPSYYIPPDDILVGALVIVAFPETLSSDWDMEKAGPVKQPIFENTPRYRKAGMFAR